MTINPRIAGPSVEPLILERWSPRAFDGSAIPDADLETIFDAARWAPSAFNAQPWRFLYARRDGA
jgi:nitroreductase